MYSSRFGYWPLSRKSIHFQITAQWLLESNSKHIGFPLRVFESGNKFLSGCILTCIKVPGFSIHDIPGSPDHETASIVLEASIISFTHFTTFTRFLLYFLQYRCPYAKQRSATIIH